MDINGLALGLGIAGLLGAAGGRTWTATLRSTDGTNLSGTARVEWNPKPVPDVTMDTTMKRDTVAEREMAGRDERYTATVTVSGARPAASLAWQVHHGKCSPTPGPIVGDDSAYQNIVTDDKGTGTAAAKISGVMKDVTDYSVSVRGGSDQAAAVVACGELSLIKTQASVEPQSPPDRR